MLMPSELTDHLLSRLAAVPPRIASITDQWSDTRSLSFPSDAWSALEILAHLRASADIITHRVPAILVRDSPPLPAFDERRWAELAHYTTLDFHTSLQSFSLRRNELLHMLQHLSPDDWERSGEHELYGPQTIFAILTTLVNHEEEHCAQLSALSPT